MILDILKLLKKEYVLIECLIEILDFEVYLQQLLTILPASLVRFDKNIYVKRLLDEVPLETNQIIESYVLNELLPLKNDFALFKNNYGENWLLLAALYSNRLYDYFTYIYNGEPILDIGIIQKSNSYQIQELRELNAQLSLENNTLKSKILNMQQTSKKTSLDNQQIELLRSEVQHYKNELDELQNEILFLKNKSKLIGSDLIIVGADWHNDIKNRLIQLYHLKSITCYSAIEQLQKLDGLNNKTVIFSTTQAKHQAFNKLKQNNTLILHMTSEKNADLIIKQLIMETLI